MSNFNSSGDSPLQVVGFISLAENTQAFLKKYNNSKFQTAVYKCKLGEGTLQQQKQLAEGFEEFLGLLHSIFKTTDDLNRQNTELTKRNQWLEKRFIATSIANNKLAAKSSTKSKNYSKVVREHDSGNLVVQTSSPSTTSKNYPSSLSSNKINSKISLLLNSPVRKSVRMELKNNRRVSSDGVLANSHQPYVPNDKRKRHSGELSLSKEFYNELATVDLTDQRTRRPRVPQENKQLPDRKKLRSSKISLLSHGKGKSTLFDVEKFKIWPEEVISLSDVDS